MRTEGKRGKAESPRPFSLLKSIAEQTENVKGKLFDDTNFSKSGVFFENIDFSTDDLYGQIGFLKRKMEAVNWFVSLKPDGEMVKWSTKQRGTHAYSLFMSEKLDVITENMKNQEGEPLFLTGTYAPKTNGRSRVESFIKGKVELRKFKRKVKNMGFKSQIGSVEATEAGYFHFHMLISDEKTIYKKWKDKKGRWRLNDEVLRGKLKEKWGLGFLDVIVVKRGKNSDATFDYITKYAGKFGCVEDALKRAERNDYEDTKIGRAQQKEDKKKIHTHYYASITNTRLFFNSRNLSATKQIAEAKAYIKELDEEIAFSVLFSPKNNVTFQSRIKQIEISKETAKEYWFIKKCGKVEKDTLEYYKLLELFKDIMFLDKYQFISRLEIERIADEALENTA